MLKELLAIRSGHCCSPDVIKESERWPRQGMDGHSRPLEGDHTLLRVLAREGIHHRVQTPRTILHSEVKAEELADPLMLRNSGQALVKQKFETVVVSTNQEVVPPQVWTPMMNCLDKPMSSRLYAASFK